MIIVLLVNADVPMGIVTVSTPTVAASNSMYVCTDPRQAAPVNSM